MRQIWLFVVATLLALTPALSFAEQAMPAAPAASGMPMQEQKGDSMGSKMESTKMENKKMEGKGAKMEDKK